MGNLKFEMGNLKWEMINLRFDPSSLCSADTSRRDKESIRLRYRFRLHCVSPGKNAGTRKAEKSFRCQTSEFRWKMGDHK
jgi:hypothetical protein